MNEDYYGSGRKPPADLKVGEYVRVGHGYQRVSHVSKQPGGWVRIALSTSVLILDGSGSWLRWPGSGDPNMPLEVGRAYVLTSGGGLIVFTGLPGAMLQFHDGAFSGYDPASDARSLQATVVGDDVLLSFDAVPGAPGIDYEVWHSPTRTGFFDRSTDSPLAWSTTAT